MNEENAYRSDIHSAHAKIQDLEREKSALEYRLQRCTNRHVDVGDLPPHQAAKAVERVRRQLELDPNDKRRCKECGGALSRIGGMFWSLFGGALGIVLALTVSWLVWNGITERKPSGRCYIEGKELMFELHREIDWGSDQRIGTYRTMDEALEDAKKVGCSTTY